MAFCTGCGADVTGKSFCVSCGKPVGAASPGAPAPQGPPPNYAPPMQGPPRQGPPMQGPPMQQGPYMQGAPMQGPPMQGPPMQGQYAPGPKKTPTWVWVLVGVFGFFLLVSVVAGFALRMFVHKVTENPALTMAKLLTAGNPDVEVVDSDPRKNTVTFRDKKTGETITLNFDDIKKGKLEFKGPKGEVATIEAQGSGQNGTVQFKGPDGQMTFGAGADAKMPAWVPVYPGSTPVGTFSMQGADGSGGSMQFTTKDPASAVLTHYENTLKSAGFKITANVTGNANGSNGGMLSAEDEGTKRTVVVTVGAENGNTTVAVLIVSGLYPAASPVTVTTPD
jgi:hypothetical protein